MTYKDDVQLTPHFKLSEFACRCGCRGEQRAIIKNNLAVIAGEWEKVRAHFGAKPVTIHSGYRCPRYNKQIGGAPQSMHINGRAADGTIAGVSPRAIGDYAAKSLQNVGGVGVYEPPGDSFTHLDTRPRVGGKVADNTVKGAATRWYE